MIFLRSYPKRLSSEIVGSFGVNVMLMNERFDSACVAAGGSPPQQRPSIAVLEVSAAASY